METTRSRSRHRSSVRYELVFSHGDVDADSDRWEVRRSRVDCNIDKWRRRREATVEATPLTDVDARTPCCGK